MSAKPTIQCAPNGPLLVRELEVLENEDGSRTFQTGKAVALCRCGASANKPFCDGAHKGAGFADPGAPDGDARATPTGGPAVGEVRVLANGPYAVRGPVELQGFADAGESLYLCRCGASMNKPFCDGSHGRIGFEG